MPFLEVSVETLAACPLGSFAMLLLDASLKMSNAKAGLEKLKIDLFWSYFLQKYCTI